MYGNRKIVLEKEETEQLKRFDEPGLILIGFKPLALLKKHHYVRPSLFVYPEESLVNGKWQGPRKMKDCSLGWFIHTHALSGHHLDATWEC